MKRSSRKVTPSFLVALAIAYVASTADAGEQAAGISSGGLADTSALREIEKRVLPDCLAEGPNRFENLPEYYWAANRELGDHFAEAQRIYETATIRPYRSMTLVAGAAGVGKTFIKDRVFKKSYATGDVCKFDIKELYQQWQADGRTAERPDLVCGDTVLNRLLAVKDRQQDDRCLVDYLKAKSAAFYMIDSLDEIHPDDYRWILDQVEQFVFETEQPFIQVVLFGRGLAFREFWQGRSGDDRSANIHLFMLNAPEFRTTGDLLVSSWNYDGFRYKLRWSPDGSAPVEMPLAAYRHWVDAGYPVTSSYQSVTFESNKAMNSKTRGLLEEWSQQQRTVGPMLTNLAGNGILRDIVEEFAVNEQPFNERQVMQDYLTAWLKRDGKSSNRPSVSAPEHLELYLALLEEVATKYLVEKKLDDYGYFAVADDDIINIHWQGKPLKFPVSGILDRSGLKLIDPRKPGTPEYRFEPIWVHRLLVEMRNERVTKMVSR